MGTSKHRPAIIRAVKSKADLVRQVARAQGVSYDETPEGDDIIVFSFKDVDDEASGKLALAMPREVFARRAVIGGDAPPGVLKKDR
jgi:hypothetical protein